MAEIKLDEKDKKILYELDMDARQPVTQIAKKVRLSREVVNYRIANLEKKGVIGGYYPVVDTTKLGYIYYRIFLKYHHVNYEKEKEIIDYARKNPFINWIASGNGRWNLTLVIWVKNLIEFEKVYDELIFKFDNYFKEKYVSAAFRIFHLKHNYLFDTNDFDSMVLGEYQSKVKLGNLDYKILSLLAKNARMSVLDISKKVKITPNSVKKRIRRLTKEKIILGFRAKINTNLLGYDHYKIFLELGNLNNKKLKSLISYLRSNPNVIYITKAVGIADLEFEIMLRSMNDFYMVMRDISYKFSEIIKDYYSILHYSEPFINYLPVEE